MTPLELCVKSIIGSQNQDGGFTSANGAKVDHLLTSWNLIALCLAKRAHSRNKQLRRAILNGRKLHLEMKKDAPASSLIASLAASCFTHDNMDPILTKRIKETLDKLKGKVRSDDTRQQTRFFAMLAASHLQRSDSLFWTEWRKSASTALTATRTKDGNWKGTDKGTRSPQSATAATALAILQLQMIEGRVIGSNLRPPAR